MSSSPADPELDTQHGVRFSDVKEEISPDDDPKNRDDLSPEIQEEIRNLSMNLQKSRVQESRMKSFAFEPMSLPGSRAQSPSQSSQSSSRRHSRRSSPVRSSAHSPPLTPAASASKEDRRIGSTKALNTNLITPQVSPPHGIHYPESGTPDSTKSGTTSSQQSKGIPSSNTSEAPSRGKRTTTSSKLDAIDPRYIFQNSKESRRSSNQAISSAAPGSNGRSSPDIKGHENKHQHHHSLFGGKGHDDEGRPSGSMSDLKRFFKFGGHKNKDKHASTESDSRSRKRTVSKSSGVQTPPSVHHAQAAVPFADDHGLESKYGKFGKVLGSGAGGSVRLMKRSNDGVTFAVKQFRPRHSYETEKEYSKKVTAEFCIGSTLHHGNIIETMDIVHEKGNWFEVMEYAPYDLFAGVMTGKMTREEVCCTLLQIVNGVTYLHSMGLAHRDLKLDNVVVGEHGIMKIIDFGSAVVFRYPFENETVRASGIVGSDPYLAPEVYEATKYDPAAVDVWSLAIIYCCMTLRRFPWKMPRTTDTSYKLFVSPPTPGQPTVESLRRLSQGVHRSDAAHNDDDDHHHHHQNRHSSVVDAMNSVENAGSTAVTPPPAEQRQPSTMKGPWRLLRLLPRESRYIIGRMLDTDPKTRATMDDVLNDHWISSRPFCEQDMTGRVKKAENHVHTLQAGGESSNAAKK